MVFVSRHLPLVCQSPLTDGINQRRRRRNRDIAASALVAMRRCVSGNRLDGASGGAVNAADVSAGDSRAFMRLLRLMFAQL